MNLSSALSNALSGLSASARGASLVSSNISNALTEGYAARELSLSARAGSTGGVQVDGISRRLDPALLADRRLADADLANAELKLHYLDRLQRMSGTPDDDGGLSARLAAFEASLIEASSRPDSETRLQGVVTAATAVTRVFNDTAMGIQSLRSEIDSSIGTQVSTLNTALAQVEQLNKSIVKAHARSQETAALHDQRQRLIDQISEIVPVKQLNKPSGVVALYSVGGAVLLDVTAVTVDFTVSNAATADKTQANGLLSGLSVGGIPLSSREDGRFGGGSLTALFELRDETLVDAQLQLDTVAMDLATRFETGLDPTLAVGAPGLFTDQGAVTADITGLADRIQINALVDPTQGGNLWRLRDGLGVLIPGEVGDSSLINLMVEQLGHSRLGANSSLGPSEKTSSEMGAAFLSAVAVRAHIGEDNRSYRAAHQAALKEAELANGVDTDHELQNLLLIEQTYAANARMVQTVDEMLDALMRIA
ncbi:MAG: flagellar hook-associated protein FlgK [Thalassovita sp.]